MAAPNLTPLDYLPEVYAAICKVQKALSRDGIQKHGRNAAQGYTFRGIDDIYNSISALLADADLCILPRMISREQEERETAKGGVLFCVTVQAEFDFVSARDGSKHTVSFFGEAMDSADKATNKAMSAAYKYCAMQVFCIPTEGMEDADRDTHQPVPLDRTAVKPQPALVKPPQPAAALTESIPDEWGGIPLPEEERSELEQQLADSQVILDAFGQLKGRYRDLGMLRTYEGFLNLHGTQSPAGFHNAEEARGCFKAMLADLKRRKG